MFIGAGLAFLSAFAESVVDVLRKKNASAFDAVTAAWSLHAVTSLAMLPVACLFAIGTGADLESGTFWLAWGVSTSVNAVASYLYMSALAVADLSLAVPILTLVPVFLLVTAPLFLGEHVSWLGGIGIVVTTIGTYGLKLEARKTGIFGPLIHLWREPGMRQMFGCAALWSVSSVFDKIAIVRAGSLWYTVFLNGGLAVVFTPFMFWRGRWRHIASGRNLLRLMPMGLVSAARSYAQCEAVALLLVPYAIGIKRLSVLFGVLWGRLIFKEKHTRQRAIASVIMLVGSIIILIALSS